MCGARNVRWRISNAGVEERLNKGFVWSVEKEEEHEAMVRTLSATRGKQLAAKAALRVQSS
eukprot:3670972-Pyramimonas_sp.AAC.1